MQTHIGIDATRLGGVLTGIERFATVVLQALTERLNHHPDWILHIYTTSRGMEKIGSFLQLDSTKRIKYHCIPESRGWLQEQIPLPYSVSRSPFLDVFYSPGHPISPLTRARRVIQQVHDLTAWRYGQTMTAGARLYWRVCLPLALRRSAHILVDSEFTRRELEHFRLGTCKPVNVLPLAVDERYFRPIEQDLVSQVLNKHGIQTPYLLVCGSLEPRKNLTFLLDVFDKYFQRDMTSNTSLVFAGGRGWKNTDFHEKVARHRHRDKIQLIGWVEDKDLPRLISGATALLYPSLYEGFGLPPVEAAAMGTPSIVSNAASLPEVMGDCALYADPSNVDQWAVQIERIASDQACRRKLAVNGKAWASQYSKEALGRRIEHFLMNTSTTG